jgi:hypothetical protein
MQVLPPNLGPQRASVVTGCLVEAGAAEDVPRVLEALVEKLDGTRLIEVEVFAEELDEAGLLLQFPKAGLQPEPQYAEVRPQYPYYNAMLVAIFPRNVDGCHILASSSYPRLRCC